MRLQCPNCGAQYEVDVRVIPAAGRDVQCSACGHSWYQVPADHAEPEAPPPPSDEDLAVDEPTPEEEHVEEEAEEEEEPEAAPEPEPEPEMAEPEPEPEPEPTPAEDEADDEEEDEDEGPAPAPLPRRQLDESVRDILQQEAAAELARRGAGAETVETQPDLGIDNSRGSEEAERVRIARERMARMRGLDEDDLDEDISPPADDGADEPLPVPEPAPVAATPAPVVVSGRGAKPRRELFPDIEEINSTLDSHGAAARDDGDEDEAKGRSGFARGFFLVILVLVIAVAVYLLAPTIAAKVPALHGVLSGYVDWVNGLRSWLDAAMQGLISRVEDQSQATQ